MSHKRLIGTSAICGAFVLMLLNPRITVGQATTGSIIGTVTDPSGAGVSGATVTIRNRDQNTTTKVVTNESGNYL